MKPSQPTRNGHKQRDRSTATVTVLGPFQNQTVTPEKPRQFKGPQPFSDRMTVFSSYESHRREIDVNAPYGPYIGQRTQNKRSQRSFGPKTTPQPALFPGPAATPKTADQSPHGMPSWLLRALEERTGGFRAARWERCTRCDQIILKGLDADTAAFTVQADPTPITPRQEQLCAAIGRPTYLLQQLGSRIELTHRDSYSTGRPATIGQLVPAHQCGARFPGFYHPHPANTTGAPDDRPPF